MRCVQVRNDEEEWDRIRTNHDELLLGNTHFFLRELFFYQHEKLAQLGGNVLRPYLKSQIKLKYAVYI